MSRLIHVCGAPASGKTTLSVALAEALGLPRFAVDDERRRLLKPGEIWPADDRKTWAALRASVEQCAAAVLETMGGTRHSEELVRGHTVFSIECRVPPPIRARRIREKAMTGEDPLVGDPRRYIVSVGRIPVRRLGTDMTWDGTADIRGPEFKRVVDHATAFVEAA
jgi:hypothetical protein